MEKPKITVFTGPNCPKCPPAKEVCREVAEQEGLELAELNIEEYMIEALQMQIASTPSIVIDNDVVFRGKAPSKEELLEEIKKRMD